MKFRASLKGFTLIELLIVVAIIAILAAIAVPNFLEAQVRAKVSRAKSDLRTVVTGLEAYRIDYNGYPFMNSSARMVSPPGGTPTLERITTPVAYLSARSVFTDPFPAKGVYENVGFTTRMQDALPDPPSLKEYFYTIRGPGNTNQGENIQWSDVGTGKIAQWYLLESSGPDQMKHYLGNILNSMTGTSEANSAYIIRCLYDPTNGTVSEGSLYRVGGSLFGRGQELGQLALKAMK